MNKKRNTAIYFYLGISLFLFILFSSFSQAAIDFSAISSAQINACSCSQYVGTMSIYNQGDAAHYVLKTTGENAALLKYQTEGIFIEPQKRQDIAYVVNIPCDANKQFTITTEIESNTGLKKELIQTINPLFCSHIQAFSIGSLAYKNCACTPTQYIIKIKNTAKYADIFSVNLDLPKEYYTVSENSFVLLPQGEKIIYIYVKLPCDFSESYSILAQIKAESTQEIQNYPLYLQIDKACYKTDISFGKVVSNLTEKNLSFVTINNKQEYQYKYNFITSPSNNFTICINTTNILPVLVQNPSNISNKYTVDLQNKQSWMKFAGQ